MTKFMTSSFAKVVFANSQGSRLFFPVVENALAQITYSSLREVNTRVYFC